MVATFFRHGSNAALAVLALALIVAFALHATGAACLALLAGALVFFGSEYTTHRFAFHAPPSKNAFVNGLQRRLHYDHHVDPAELHLLFLPLWFALPVAAIYALIAYALTRDAALTIAATLGAVLALFYYEWVHYVAHIPFVPVTPFGKWIKKYHLRHHFLNEKLWFGVTNPVVDIAGFTYRRTADADRSSTTKFLYGKK